MVALLDRVLTESLTRTQVVAVVLLLSALVYAPLRSRAWALARRLTRGRRDAPYDVVAGLAERLDRVDGVEDRLREVAEAVAGALGVAYVGLEVERIGGGTWSTAVGTRPAEVCGLSSRPRYSRSCITLRTVAADTLSLSVRVRVREPTGSPVSI